MQLTAGHGEYGLALLRKGGERARKAEEKKKTRRKTRALEHRGAA